MSYEGLLTRQNNKTIANPFLLHLELRVDVPGIGTYNFLLPDGNDIVIEANTAMYYHGVAVGYDNVSNQIRVQNYESVVKSDASNTLNHAKKILGLVHADMMGNAFDFGINNTTKKLWFTVEETAVRVTKWKMSLIGIKFTFN